MSKHPIHITSDITLEKLQKGTFIFIFRATRIPPHLGIITNGLLYDITSVGPNIGLSVSDFYRTVLKRKTEVIFIELERSDLDLTQIITEKVHEYWKVTPTTSCLNPIKGFVKEVYSINVASAKFIFELLPLLYENKLIKNVSQLHLSSKLTNNTFELEQYTEKDIEKCIVALQRKEKAVC